MEQANKAPTEAWQANGWLQQVYAPQWFERQFERMRTDKNLFKNGLPKDFPHHLEQLLGRKVAPNDPASGWTLYEPIYVAQRLMFALVSGCVPLPRTQPLPPGELPNLLGYAIGLPHGTTWPEAPAK